MSNEETGPWVGTLGDGAGEGGAGGGEHHGQADGEYRQPLGPEYSPKAAFTAADHALGALLERIDAIRSVLSSPDALNSEMQTLQGLRTSILRLAHYVAGDRAQIAKLRDWVGRLTSERDTLAAQYANERKLSDDRMVMLRGEDKDKEQGPGPGEADAPVDWQATAEVRMEEIKHLRSRVKELARLAERTTQTDFVPEQRSSRDIGRDWEAIATRSKTENEQHRAFISTQADELDRVRKAMDAMAVEHGENVAHLQAMREEDADELNALRERYKRAKVMNEHLKQRNKDLRERVYELDQKPNPNPGLPPNIEEG